MKAVTLVVLLIMGLCACSHAPKATRYILDSGTTGWVKIKYNRVDAPELPVENGFAIVRISQDLTVSTRNRMNSSWDRAEFYYRTSAGKLKPLRTADNEQRQLWALEKITDGEGEREVFFVGEQELFTSGGKLRGDHSRGSMNSSPVEATMNPLDRMKIETSLPK